MPHVPVCPPVVQVAAVDPSPPLPPAGEAPDEKVVASVPERAVEEKAAASGQLPQSQSPLSPPQEADETKKKPAGAVSLFGGIDVLGQQPDALKVRRGIVTFYLIPTMFLSEKDNLHWEVGLLGHLTPAGRQFFDLG